MIFIINLMSLRLNSFLYFKFELDDGTLTLLSMKNGFFLLTIVTLFSAACKPDKIESQDHRHAKEIDFGIFNRNIQKLSQALDDVAVVKIQSTDNFKIQLIQEVLTVGDKIFLVQFGRGINEIYCLDFEGNLLYVINGIGEGPLEYTEIHDVYFDASGQYLTLLDRPTKKRVYFNFAGEAIKEDFSLRDF